MESAGNSRHIDDGEAADVIYAPGQYPVIENRVSSHIASCRVCAERLRALRDADRAVGELLSTLDEPAPVVSESAVIRAGRTTLRTVVLPAHRRAAAVLGFMTFAAVAAAAIPASPLHQLIVQALASGQKSPAEDTATGKQPQTQAPASPGVFFTPESTLEVMFERRGTAGVLHVRMVDGDQVSLSSPDSGSTYRVSSSRITVDQAPRGNFELSLPRSLRDVRIGIGGELVFERRQAAPTGPDNFTIQLSRSNPHTRSP